MTKEQIEQAAKELELDFERCYDDNTSPTGGGYEADYTDKWGFYRSFKPFIDQYAAAYHGQGWVSVEEMGNFAEWVRCNYIKVAQGYMYRLASIGSSATKYFQMSDLIKMYLMKPLPSPLNEKK